MKNLADRIKGITVVLGGDTTGLNKALSGTNKEIKDTQAQLKDVERLLKMDPSNTILLEQKQRLLGDAVAETKKKLDTLNKANEQVSKSQKNYDAWKKAFDPIQEEIGQTSQKLKDLKDRQQEMKDAGEIDTEAYNALQSEISATSQQLTALKKEAKKVSEEFGNPIGKDQYDALQREIIATKKELDRLEEQAKKSNVAVQKISEATKKVAEGSSKISESLDKMKGVATVASGAVVAGGALAVKTITDMDSAIKDFSVKTGLSAEGIDYWKESLEDVYNAGYGENFEDIADSMALIKNQIGALDTTNLTELTENAFVLRDVFGYDVSESVRSAKALMDNFGISGNEAFEFIAAGAQNGLDYSGELLDSISEYSVQFGKFGFTAEEMFAIFAAGAQNGAFNLDKVGDAVKEFAIRAIDGSDTTVAGFEAIGLSADDMASKIAAGGEDAKQAFQKTITALSEMKDPVERNAAGVQLFGTMWEDLGEDAVLALANTNDYLSETEGTLSSIKETKYDTLTEQLQTLGRTVQTDVLAPLAEQLMPTLEKVVEFAEKLVEKFSQMTPEQQNFAVAIGGIVAVLPFVLSLLSGVFTAIGTISMGIDDFAFLMSGTVIPAISTAFSFITTTVLPAVGNAFSSIFGFIIANPITLLIAAIVGLVALIAAKGDEIQAFFQKVDDFLQNIFVKDWKEVFGPVLGDILNGFFKNIENIWNSIKQILDGVIDFIRGVFTGDWHRAWQGVLDIFGGIFNAIVSVAKAPLNALIGLLNGAISAINLLINGFNSIGFTLPKWLGGGSWSPNLPNIPSIPYLAKGGTVLSGSAIVGEAGPELLTVGPTGTRVQPLTGNTSNTTNLGGINMTIYGAPGQNVKELADIVMDEIQTLTAQKGAVFGA